MTKRFICDSCDWTNTLINGKYEKCPKCGAPVRRIQRIERRVNAGNKPTPTNSASQDKSAN